LKFNGRRTEAHNVTCASEALISLLIKAEGAMNTRRARVGLVGIGLQAYWQQFAGLEERLRSYVTKVGEKISAMGVGVIDLGLVDTAAKGVEAGHRLRREDVDILVIYATTYALSSSVLPMIQRGRVPVLLLNLQPERAVDYSAFNALGDRTRMTGEWLAWCASCPVPEIANVMCRAGISVHQVTGVLENDPDCWNEIAQWMRAADVVATLAAHRVGLLGHYYSGMLDIYTDLTALCITFGGVVEILEVDELSALRDAVTRREISMRVQEFQSHFEVESGCALNELERAACTSVALDRMVAKNELTALAYYYKGTGVPANEDTMSSIILGTSMLTARGVPVAGEYEVKNVLAMKIMDCLGAGGSFTEFYAIDFNDDVVLMGHDGPGHIGIAEGKTLVRPLDIYHGKVGRGLSVEMSVRNGPVTLLSVVEDSASGKFLLLIAEATVESGPRLEIGNTNSRFRFSLGARGFVSAWNAHGPAHHCAVGVGHHAGELKKVAALLNIKAVHVC
jgi:L-arabinose isomerase